MSSSNFWPFLLLVMYFTSTARKNRALPRCQATVTVRFWLAGKVHPALSGIHAFRLLRQWHRPLHRRRQRTFWRSGPLQQPLKKRCNQRARSTKGSVVSIGKIMHSCLPLPPPAATATTTTTMTIPIPTPTATAAAIATAATATATTTTTTTPAVLLLLLLLLLPLLLLLLLLFPAPATALLHFCTTATTATTTATTATPPPAAAVED